MFELLNLWGQYVDIIYMSEAEIHMLEKILSSESKLGDESFAER